MPVRADSPTRIMRAVTDAGIMVDDQHFVCDTAARYLVCSREPWATHAMGSIFAGFSIIDGCLQPAPGGLGPARPITGGCCPMLLGGGSAAIASSKQVAYDKAWAERSQYP